MKRYSFFVLCWLLTGAGFSQNVALFNTSQGVLIQVDAQKPGTFILEKAMEGGKFRALTTLEAPGSRAVVAERLTELSVRFPFFQSIPDRAEQLWQAYQKGGDLPAYLDRPENWIALGLAFLDAEVEDKATYRYRLQNGKEARVQFFVPQPFGGAWTKQPVREETRGVAEFHWFSKDALATDRIQVLRKRNDEQDFAVIQSHWISYRAFTGDSVFVRFRDTSLSIAGQYQYLVQPMDSYGNLGAPLSPVTYNYIDPVNRPAAERLQLDGKKLVWELSQPELASSIEVYRGRSVTDSFSRVAVLAPSARSFEDHQDIPMELMFYYLVVNDVRGNQVRSLFSSTIDKTEIPAFAPERIHVEFTEQGVVVRWPPAIGSVRGYHVYRTLGYRGAWAPASGFLPRVEGEQVWVDSLSSLLAGEVYSYSIQTESETYQKSDYSPSRAVRIPRQEALPTAEWIDARVQRNGINIRWEDLFQRIPGLQSYQLYRRVIDQPNSLELLVDSIPRGENKIEIALPTEPGEYAFSIVAIDIFGNQSPPSQEALVHWTNGTPPPKKILVAQKSQDGIGLEWSAVQNETLQVQRSTNGGAWELVHTAQPGAQFFLDRGVQKGILYQYRLGIPEQNGQNTPVSDPVIVRF